MVDVIRGLLAADLRANLERVKQTIVAAGRSPAEVQILAAVKYLPVEELEALAEAGITLLGENRAQELLTKAKAYPDRFTWDFIGALQSRKVAQLLPHVRYIHSVASDSALTQLQRHGRPDTKVLVEVNVAADPGKAGVTPEQLGAFLDRCPVEVVGLMTMPPVAGSPEDSRPHFAALRSLADRFGLGELSMGTTQDYSAAVQEGATIIRLGSGLYQQKAPGAP
jgi:pyridoxal phosphate enzyme (YggS family)